jgi:uncharacterized protein DUF1707
VSDPILATDAERDAALALLREASVDGRLTLEDLAEGVEVQLTGGAALSSEDVRVRGTPPAGAPLIRIRHSGVMGSISVRSPRRRS